MKSNLQRTLICLASMAALIVPRAAAQEQTSISFSFAPTDGERWIRTGEHTSVQDVGGGQPISETQTLHEVSFEYHRVDEGWEVVQIPRRAELLIDGVAHANTAMAQTIGLPITVAVDEGGVALSVDGFRALMRRFEDELPPAEFAQVTSTMTQEGFEQTEIYGWNKKLDLLRGATVSLGEKWRVKKFHSVGRNSIPVDGVLRFEGWAELDGNRAFKILYDADNRGKAVARYGEGVSRTLDLVEGAGDNARAGLTIRVAQIMMVVPQTGQMIYLSEEDEIDLRNAEMKNLPGAEGHFENRNIERWKRAE